MSKACAQPWCKRWLSGVALAHARQISACGLAASTSVNLASKGSDALSQKARRVCWVMFHRHSVDFALQFGLGRNKKRALKALYHCLYRVSIKYATRGMLHRQHVSSFLSSPSCL
jgi:hypothetical protein